MTDNDTTTYPTDRDGWPDPDEPLYPHHTTADWLTGKKD